jgi:hypothetical protein
MKASSRDVLYDTIRKFARMNGENHEKPQSRKLASERGIRTLKLQNTKC